MLHMFVYLSPMGWPCIYSRCFTSWMVIRILSHWRGYFLDIGFVYGYRKCSSIWNYFFPLLVGSRLMSCNIVNYLTFLTDKIYLDLLDNILLWIILFPLSMEFDLQNMGFLDYL